jgi:hypothetical protein
MCEALPSCPYICLHGVVLRYRGNFIYLSHSRTIFLPPPKAPKFLFPCDFAYRYFAFISCYPAHLILVILVVQSSPFPCYCVPRTNIMLCTLFSDTFSLCFSLSMGSTCSTRTNQQVKLRAELETTETTSLLLHSFDLHLTIVHDPLVNRT